MQQKLVTPICTKIGAMDLLAVRNLLKKSLDVLQSSTDAGASTVFSPIGYHALPSVFLPVDLGCILAPEPFFYLDFGQRSSLDVNAPCKWTDQNMF